MPGGERLWEASYARNITSSGISERNGTRGFGTASAWSSPPLFITKGPKVFLPNNKACGGIRSKKGRLRPLTPFHHLAPLHSHFCEGRGGQQNHVASRLLDVKGLCLFISPDLDGHFFRAFRGVINSLDSYRNIRAFGRAAHPSEAEQGVKGATGRAGRQHLLNSIFWHVTGQCTG